MYQDPRDMRRQAKYAYKMAREQAKLAKHQARAQIKLARAQARYARRAYQYQYGRRERFLSLPLLICVILAINFHHWFWTFGAVIFLLLLIASITQGRPWLRRPQMPPLQQQPEQQPSEENEPYYSPPQPEQSYEQGYQAPPQSTYQEGGQQHEYPSQPGFDRYEQPQAQYPEQMPPMQQR